MSNYEFGVGEYHMRNGWQAWIIFEVPDPHDQGYHPFIGYYWDEEEQLFCVNCWLKNGRDYAGCMNGPHDLMPPRREWWVTYTVDNWIEGTDSPERKEVLESEAEELELSVVHFVELRPGEKIVSEVNDE